MATTKVAITLDEELLKELDALVKKGIYSNRSSAIQDSIKEALTLLSEKNFEAECSKLNPTEERNLANESYPAEVEWPKY